MVQELENDDRLFLVALDQKLWRVHWDPRLGHWKEKTGTILTQQEYKRVKMLISKYELVCEITNTAFGFSIGLALFEHPNFPYTPLAQLVTIGAGALPWQYKTPQEQWERAWTEFVAIVTVSRNQELLVYYNCKPIGTRTSYQY